jgi:hypothetical protein
MGRRRVSLGVAVALGCGGFALGVWASSVGANAAADQPRVPKAPPAGWLQGTTDERLSVLERHLRGLDVSMAEVGYRYGELLIAGKERNWEYAAYQAEKIDLSLRLAVERRPKRADSARPFLADDLPPVLAAAKAKDAGELDAALTRLHAGCVECHKRENVLYFKGAVDRIKDAASR